MHNFHSSKSFLLIFGFLLFSYAGFSQDDDFETDTHSKVRLGFYSHSGFYRQILLGFKDALATDGIDPGYDAITTFNLPNDIYFYCNNQQLFIQGVGYFSDTNSYPLGIKSSAQGNITIKLESTEYFSPTQTFYIFDNTTGHYHNLKSTSFTTSVGIGTFNDRFSLRFLDQTILGVDNPKLNNGVKVDYFSNNGELSITNNLSEAITSEVVLFNLLGQQAEKWNVERQDQKQITIPLSHYSKGIYIVNVKTSLGVISKKISIK